MFGGEGDVRPFALPGVTGGEDACVRNRPHPGLLVWPVADGGKVLGAVVGPVLHGPKVAQLIPLAAVLPPNDAVANPTIAEFTVTRGGSGAVDGVLPVELACPFTNHHRVARPVR